VATKTRKAPVNSRALLDAQIAEGKLQRDIIDLLHKLRYLVNHNYDSRRSGPDKGLPDLIIVGHGRLIFVELKKRGGKVALAQRVWRQQLMEAGAEAYVWWPSDWSSGAIDAILRPQWMKDRTP
jgi:hypothetical protein